MGFWEELRTAYDAEEPARRWSAVFDGFRPELVSAFDAELGGDEEALVADLEARWPRLEEAASALERRYRALLARMGESIANDPAALAVDLLDVVGRPLDEVVHTRVLARLIDPATSHGQRLLRSFVRVADPRFAESLPERLSAGCVHAERGRQLGAAWIIPDIVVELTGESGRGLVVIENKIRVRDRDGQLDAYRRWVERERPAASCLIYLTPTGEAPCFAKDPSPWRHVSYAAIAEAWREDLRVLDGPWAEVLRLYLATVMQRVLGLSLPARTRREQTLFIPYLEAALGDPADVA